MRDRLFALVLGGFALVAGGVSADQPPIVPTAPTPQELEQAVPVGAAGSGEEIWDHFLANRFRSATATLRIVSTDPGGASQETLLRVRWKDFAHKGEVEDSVIGKTWVRFEQPFDMRSFTYLGITRRGLPDAHFVFRDHGDGISEQFGNRRVRRIRLDGVGVLGTDYTFDEVAYHALEDATYERLPDGQESGRPVYVVEARLKAYMDTQYPTSRAYIDKQHYVLLRQEFWDHAGVRRRELRANVETIEEFPGGLWTATQSTMHDLKARTTSTLTLEGVQVNPELSDRLFSTHSLLSHH